MEKRAEIPQATNIEDQARVPGKYLQEMSSKELPSVNVICSASMLQERADIIVWENNLLFPTSGTASCQTRL